MKINANQRTIYDIAASQLWKGKSIRPDNQIEINDIDDDSQLDEIDIDISIDKEDRWEDH